MTNKTACYILIIVAAVKRSVITEATMRGCSSMVEHQPSKLDTWVRFPSPALFIAAEALIFRGLPLFIFWKGALYDRRPLCGAAAARRRMARKSTFMAVKCARYFPLRPGKSLATYL